MNTKTYTELIKLVLKQKSMVLYIVYYIYTLKPSTIVDKRPKHKEQFRVRIRNSGFLKWLYKRFTIMYMFNIVDKYPCL